MYKWRTGRWNAASRLTFNVNSDTPPPKHKIRVRSMTTTGTSLERIPIHSWFSEGRETQLYYGRGKTGVPGEKTAAHGTRLNDANPERNIARPGGTATTPTNLTNNFKMLPDRGWHHLPKKNDIGMPIVDPRLSRYTNTSKSAREIFAAILNESHRLTSIMTQTAKDQEK